ncbi:MAG TPA: sugar ABC transporter substrate-binding protein [Devosia sp.]|jgi:ribose transport system substrate-binding protein|uniref:sugar ABC transporter substrate-binding protein n=1 Tax=Devosia sp. TaxID=1871048 RepID=UPI002DDD7C16|nr:sugar ABC transporter substrate-binding protein [Devosia sp.]HEV2514339.1 sugar ABC transporter substrate-binding protein [Devosia sp.]
MNVKSIAMPVAMGLFSLFGLQGSLAATAVQNAPSAGTPAADVAADLGFGNPTPALCAGKTYTIGYDVFSDVQEFAAAMTGDMKAVASALGCVEFVVLTDNVDPATALSNVKTFVERKVDGVVLFQVVASAQKGIMDTLDAAGIPAIAVAVPAPGAPFMSIEDQESGRIAGRNLADSLVAAGKADTAVLLLGEFPAGGDAVLARANGVLEGLREKLPNFPDSQVVRVDGGASADSGYTAAISVLSKLPADSAIAVTAVNDDVVAGLARALQTNGRTENVYVAGMGVVAPSGAKFVCASPLYVGGVAFYPENWGKYIVPAILAKIQGKDLPEVTYLPQQWASKADVVAAYPDTCK